MEDSIAGVPSVISAEEVAIVPAATEVPTKVGVQNILDPYLYEHFVQMANVTWSTSQVEGTVLWYTALHPSKMNNIVAYLTKIYNAWGGGMEFKLKVMGTGFHAGLLAMARLPPNIHPDSIRGIDQWTLFEYMIFDPKALDPMTKTLIDQKNIAYHYGNKLDESDPSTFGGWFVVFVFSPLRTSSTGNNQINVAIWNRLSPDFTVAQVVPLRTIENSGTSIEAAQAIFPRDVTLTDPYTGLKTEKLVVTTETVVPPTGKFNVCDFNSTQRWGATKGTWSLGQQFLNALGVQENPSDNNYYNTGGGFYSCSEVLGRPLECITRPMFIGYKTAGIWQPKRYRIALDSTHTVLTGTPETTATLNMSNPSTSGTTWYWITGPADGIDSITPQPDAPTTVPVNVLAESIVKFQSSVPTYSNPVDQSEVVSWQYLQPFESAEVIKKLRGMITRQQSIMYIMYDKPTGLPVRYFRLSYDGILTTTRSAGIVIFDLDQYELSPAQIILATDPLPVTQNVMANMMMCQQRDRQERKLKLRGHP